MQLAFFFGWDIIPETIRTGRRDQGCSSTQTGTSWCGTYMTPEHHTALDVAPRSGLGCGWVVAGFLTNCWQSKKRELLQQSVINLARSWDVVHYWNSSTDVVKLQDKFDYLMSSTLFLLPLNFFLAFLRG